MLAQSKGAFFGYEGTVMSGTPSLRLAQESLAGCRITGARGILNGTTNYMLTQMESGREYADVLAEAQYHGYAETDPRGDVEGHDAAGKLAIVANIILGAALKPSDVATMGITGISAADVAAARAAGERWKLIASATRADDGKIVASVRPERLPLSDPLASVGGITNAITYQTDLMGAVTLIGAGAGGQQTGFAILSDLLAMQRATNGSARS
jgi:homoserine dehydrogenase